MTILLPKRKFWTDTPLNDIQSNIKRKQGAYDYEVYNKNCRTTIIRDYIKELIFEGKIEKNFTLVDLFCGDAIIIRLLKQRFKLADITGVDIHKFKEHEAAIDVGVKFKYEYVQEYIKDCRDKIDIVLMMNTYRNFKTSNMTERDFRKINKWILKVANHAIVTVNISDIKKVKRRGFKPLKIGKGEASSDMVDLKGKE